MGSFFHTLKDNKTGEFPRNWCFVDTETSEIIIDNKTKKQVLRLGAAIYTRDRAVKKKKREISWSFYDIAGFWDRLIIEAEQDRRLILMAYNIGFDSRILSMFSFLPKLGYKLANIFDKGQVFICSWVRGKHKITVLDAMNYFTGKLADWGELLGVPKGEVDFTTVNDTELMEYCKNDVLILKLIWERWRDFVTKNDLGCFSPTKSSQALSGFRHRFMNTKIHIHANPRAIQIERDSYYGGRTEGFRLGDISGGPFYKLDVNSMYPYLMQKISVPVRLRRIVGRCDISQIREAIRKYAVVAEVTIKTDLPIYPFRKKGSLIYPVGKFLVTLAGPELEVALKRKHVKRIHNAVLYDSAIIFRQYIQELYALRQEYKQQDNIIFEQLVKYLMNCLYGKFGQRNEVWNKTDRLTDCEDGIYFYPGESLQTGITYRVISGEVFEFAGTKDAIHSFHAISSFITSAARVYLWSMIEKAGRSHVFYVDTDSLIVDKIGYKSLLPMIDENELGMLKVEEITNELSIYAPKDYKTDSVTRIKGISSQYTKLSGSVYTGWQWQGIRGAIRENTKDCVIMMRRNKVLRRDCTKGILQTSGVVLPFVLAGDTALSRNSIRLI